MKHKKADLEVSKCSNIFDICRGLVPQEQVTSRMKRDNLAHQGKQNNSDWRYHFIGILINKSHFNLIEQDKARQRPGRPHLAEVPSLEELDESLLSISIMERLEQALEHSQKR